jgi:hypothetical protein
MGRAKVLWTSPRSIGVSATEVSVQFRIPLCEEKGFMGGFRDAVVRDGVLLVNYNTTPEIFQIKEHPIVFERVSREITFN